MRNTSLIKLPIFLCVFSFLFACNNEQWQKRHSEKALALLKTVAEHVHTPEKKSFKLTINEDKLSADGTIITEHKFCTINAVKPDKLFVDNKSKSGNFNYLYDGDYFTYYSKDENNYVTLHAPATTVAMIDSMHNGFGFKFPAADFMYPSLKEDIEEFFPSIDMKINEVIDGKHCTKIIARNDNVVVGIWVSDQTNLPERFEVIYKKQKNIKYEAIFSDWDLNPSFSDSIFYFVAPENASLIDIMAENK